MSCVQMSILSYLCPGVLEAVLPTRVDTELWHKVVWHGHLVTEVAVPAIVSVAALLREHRRV